MSVVGLLFAFTVPFSVALVGVTFVASLVVAVGRRRRGREALLAAVDRAGDIGRDHAVVVGRVRRQRASPSPLTAVSLVPLTLAGVAATTVGLL